MMAAKKKRFTQVCFLRLENVEAGSAIRSNFAYILFKAFAEINGGEFKETKNAYSAMIDTSKIKGEDPVMTDKECISRIDYAGYYSKAQLDEKAEKLVKLCEEKRCTLGPATIARCSNKLAMETELFTWEWEL